MLVLGAMASLQWRYQHDAPIMLYLSFLMDHFHYVPYCDFFDMNLPGTYFCYYLIGRLSGYTDLGVRIADLIIMGFVLFLNWRIMRAFGLKVAWAGSVLWGLAYLRLGPETSLQREALVLVPIVAAVYLSTSLEKLNFTLKSTALGLLFGIAATIKPHAAIGLPLLLLFIIVDHKKNKPDNSSGLRTIIKFYLLPSIIGFSIPLIAVLLYLAAVGALAPFFDIAVNYWRLYAHLTGNHESIIGYKRITYLLQNYRNLGEFTIWFAAAVVGVFISLYHSTLNSALKRQVILLAGLTFCYSIYTLLAGQFWSYHWLLFLFFLIQLCSLTLVRQNKDSTKGERLFPIAVFLLTVVLAVNPPPDSAMLLFEHKLPAIKSGQVDEIAVYLQANLRPGDTVQPLDWTGGAVHALLISRAKLATRFVYDFHFYHDISNPYIQNLRKEFISELKAAQPRFIVQIFGENKRWVYGADTTREFQELQSLLDQTYGVIAKGDGYYIYELRGGLEKL
ncbi:MAG: hypothetical protein NTW14_03490 [bacterium]|nr:hypothetical protein [bacterium]